MRTTGLALTLCAALTLVPSVARAQAGTPPTAVEAVRAKLLRLPYYGVFDFIAFTVDKGTVSLKGYAYHPSLKEDAERAVKQVPGVMAVTNGIEVLPTSMMDDDLRWRAYFAIYTDPFLSRYAPGGGAAWGHLHPVPGYFGGFGRFPGMEPVGAYPIAIIVKGGHITLMGVVDTEMDKTVAGMRVSGLPGSFGVENLLTIERSGS